MAEREAVGKYLVRQDWQTDRQPSACLGCPASCRCCCQQTAWLAARHVRPLASAIVFLYRSAALPLHCAGLWPGCSSAQSASLAACRAGCGGPSCRPCAGSLVSLTRSCFNVHYRCVLPCSRACASAAHVCTCTAACTATCTAAGLMGGVLSRTMLVACEVAVEYWMALTWSPQAQWLRESDKAGELQVGWAGWTGLGG